MSGLQGRAIALSIGDAPDRAKLGFPDREIRRVLFSLSTALIREGYTIVYAGDLRPDGFTLAMFRFLAGTYAGQGVTPFTNVVPEPAVRRVGFDAIMASAKAAHGVADVAFVVGDQLHPVRRTGDQLLIGKKGPDRRSVKDDAEFSAWLSQFPVSSPAEGFRKAREAVSREADGRVSMGGKMGLLDRPDDRYEGAMPGIAEEAILSLEAGKAYVPLAAFGGATRDVAIALDLLSPKAKTPRSKQASSYARAMGQLRRLRGRVPEQHRDRLRALAANEGAENLAQEVLLVLRDWN